MSFVSSVYFPTRELYVLYVEFKLNYIMDDAFSVHVRPQVLSKDLFCLQTTYLLKLLMDWPTSSCQDKVYWR